MLASLLFASLASAANYTLSIDGKSYDLDLGEKRVITLPDGKELALVLAQKDILTFQTRNFSFSHEREWAPSRADLGEGIWQTMMTTPVGTMVLIQEYEAEDLDPADYVDLVLESIVGEERAAGYTVKTENNRKILGDGTELPGKVSVATLAGAEEYVREIYTFSGKNSGFLVLTQIERANIKSEQRVLDLFWESVNIKMK